MANKDARLIRQGQDLLDRLEQHFRRPTGKIASRGAEIRHEQRVTDKCRVSDHICHAGGCMAGRVENIATHLPNMEAVAIAEQSIELAGQDSVHSMLTYALRVRPANHPFEGHRLQKVTPQSAGGLAKPICKRHDNIDGKMHSAGLNYSCLRNPRVIEANLSRPGAVGEDFYRRRDSEALPDELYVSF